jgi:hypothetical protein
MLRGAADFRGGTFLMPQGKQPVTAWFRARQVTRQCRKTWG